MSHLLVTNWAIIWYSPKVTKSREFLRQLLTLEVISTPGLSRARKRERSGRWRASAPGLR
jgi:hypothetical protein